MRKLYLFAAMAAMLAACSSDDLTKESAVAQQNADDGAVVFDAYQSRGTTRAGKTGTMTLDLLKQPDAGFGVFGYYTNNEGYSELAKPDFMYNQDVKYTTGWVYSPIKYWPNEFGEQATSERVDYLTFFAYAPYVQVEPKTGKVEGITSDETGIIGLTRNTAIGDPLVKYVINFNPAEGVDLCYGVVADADFEESVTGTSGSPKNKIEVGKPYIDVIKPQANSKIKFDFKHALAQLNVQIDADIDDDVHSHANAVNENTRIYVRSVSFEGFTDKGTLNLNSTADKAVWYDISGTGNLSTTAVSVFDGRYDGREGVANVTAPAESPLGLNNKIIQKDPYTITPPLTTTNPGVTNTAVNLFNSTTLTDPILVIPNDQPLSIKVVYDVETYDPNLATFLSDGRTKGSTIENSITKSITINNSTMTLAAGKRYIVKLHLGLTSVKFDASVDNWASISPIEGEYDLPINNGSTVAAPAGTPISVTIPAIGVTNATFVVTGLTAGSTTNVFSGDFAPAPAGSAPGTSVSVTVDETGIATVKYTIPANTTINKRTGNLTVTSGDVGTLQITQLPVALGLNIATGGPKAKESAPIVLQAGTSVTIETNDFKNATWTVVRKRNGLSTTLEPNASTPGPGEYKAAENSGSPITANLTFGDEILAGDVYTITIQAGDAEPETVTYTVEKAEGTISFASGSDRKWVINSAGFNEALPTISKTGDGSVTYSIAKISGTGVTNADIPDPTSNTVNITSATVGDKFEVTATVVDSDNYHYADKTATYTIEIVQSLP